MLGNMCRESFQFTPLREGRQVADYTDSEQEYFNSRPSARGDRFVPSRRKSLCGISIHAPPRGATYRYYDDAPVYPDFNSRPSARGDYNELIRRGLINISIHAPPRGATLTEYNTLTGLELFQFTPLREGRRGNWVRKIKTIDISIHAPPRGATGRVSTA